MPDSVLDTSVLSNIKEFDAPKPKPRKLFCRLFPLTVFENPPKAIPEAAFETIVLSEMLLSEPA